MSLNQILATAGTGLSAAQAGMQVAAANVANAGVAGAARQALTPTTAVTAGRISGVDAGVAQRVADHYAERQLLTATSGASHGAALAGRLDWAQRQLGGTSGGDLLSAALADVAARAATVAANPASAPARSALTGALDTGLALIGGLHRQLSADQRQTGGVISALAQQASALLGEVDRSNDAVVRARATGTSSAGAEAQRAAALTSLADLIAITPRPQPDGRIWLDGAGGLPLLDQRVHGLNQMGAPGGAPGGAPALMLGNDSGHAAVPAADLGGRLGALAAWHDQHAPALLADLDRLAGGLAAAVNDAANRGTSVPPPTRLDGRATGLGASDRLGFAGQLILARTAPANGETLDAVRIDLAALGAGATLADLPAAIASASGGRISAAVDAAGRLSLASTDGSGLVIAAGNPPAQRAGAGFAAFFGLNDMITAGAADVRPAGLLPSDPLGIAPGTGTTFVLRAADGRMLAAARLTGAAGATVGDLLDQLNASPLAAFGPLALDAGGRLQIGGGAGVRLTTTHDSSDRLNSGMALGRVLGLASEQGREVGGMTLSPALAQNPAGVAVAALAAGGGSAGDVLASGNGGNGPALAASIAAPLDRAIRLLADAGAASSRASAAAAASADQLAAQTELNSRISGVNIDEEMAAMVALQASYSASARLISTTSAMFDTLIAMAR